jgi:hypothetical protein
VTGPKPEGIPDYTQEEAELVAEFATNPALLLHYAREAYLNGDHTHMNVLIARVNEVQGYPDAVEEWGKVRTIKQLREDLDFQRRNA